MKFKVLCLCIGLALLVAGAAAATMTVSVDSATVSAGSKAVIPVKVSGASNLGAMDLVITYDPVVLKFSGADLGEISTNGMIDSNSATPGTVKIAAKIVMLNGSGDALGVVTGFCMLSVGEIWL